MFTTTNSKARRAAISISGLLAFVFHAILTGIVVRLATAGLSRLPVYHTALAAAALDILVIPAILGALLYQANVFGKHWPTRKLLSYGMSIAGLVLLTIALLLSIYILGWAHSRLDFHTSQKTSMHSKSLINAGFAVWTLDVIFLSVFHVFCLVIADETHTSSPEDQTFPRTSPAGSEKRRSLSVTLKSLPHLSPPRKLKTPEPLSPTYSGYSSHRSSLKDSMHHVFGPITSRTKLVLAQSLHSHDSTSRREPSLSLDIACRGDGFESWDTSEIDEQYGSPSVERSTRQRLETIPGSRPPSPAKALDGPFINPWAPEAVPLPESPISSRPATPRGEQGYMCGLPLPPLRRNDSDAESFIHPLFRSNSVDQLPAASPGTVVIASPFAGQIVTPDSALVPRNMRSANSSRPGTPRAHRMSRADSAQSVRRPSALGETSPTSPTDHKAWELPGLS